ncbi:MAG TPA: hypothetical protein VII45_10880, partial [Solirubrobacterales bacterium]
MPTSGRPAPSRAPTAPAHSPAVGRVLALQRSAGNAATAGWLRRAATRPSLVVQRHNSPEHQLLGDTKPSDFAQARQLDPSSPSWYHIVEDQLERVAFFRSDAKLDPREAFPQIRWIQLGASRLWVSSGELSAFGDYLPNPETID